MVGDVKSQHTLITDRNFFFLGSNHPNYPIVERQGFSHAKIRNILLPISDIKDGIDCPSSVEISR